MKIKLPIREGHQVGRRRRLLQPRLPLILERRPQEEEEAEGEVLITHEIWGHTCTARSAAAATPLRNSQPTPPPGRGGRHQNHVAGAGGTGSHVALDQPSSHVSTSLERVGRCEFLRGWERG